ncbi:MAG: hypothetical protein ACFE8G_00915 [Candidatus Hermodarchaeota archaeon]
MILSIFSIFSDLFPLMMILLSIFLIIPFTFLFIIAIWVYKDAKKRDINAVVWAIIVWIIPFFIGVIIYLRMRDRISEETP